MFEQCECTCLDYRTQLIPSAVARHPHGTLFLRRSVLPASASTPSDTPAYGTDLVSTTYLTTQNRRNAVGSALLGLERAGRLRSPNAGAAASPPELTHPGVPHFGNSNRLKNGARRGWAVGMWSSNREEWQVVDLACQAYGLVSVSLYDTLGSDVTKYM